MSRRFLIFALLAVLPVLPGCGSGSGEAVAQHPAPTKKQFLRQAAAICVHADKEISEVYGRYSEKPYPGGKPPTEAKMNQVAEEVVIPARRKEVRRLRTLGAPQGEGRRIEEILMAVEKGIEQGEKDRRTLRATGGTEYAFAKALELEVNYGLPQCGLG